MTVITPPLYLDVDSFYGAKDLGIPFRDLLGEGVVTVASNALLVTQRGAGANMSVDVAAGVAWVKGDDSSTQPLYRCYNDALINVAVTTSDPTNPRIDRVIAEVRDATFAGAFSDWRLRIMAGTPAGSPSAPALPNNAISLATIAVAAAASSIVTANITDARTNALLGAGTSPLASSTPATRVVSGTSDTLILGDANNIVETSSGSATTLTIPLNSSVAYPVGTMINLIQTGAGQVTVAAGGTTLNGYPGLKLSQQWATATLLKRAADTWLLFGSLAV